MWFYLSERDPVFCSHFRKLQLRSGSITVVHGGKIQFSIGDAVVDCKLGIVLGNMMNTMNTVSTDKPTKWSVGRLAKIPTLRGHANSVFTKLET